MLSTQVLTHNMTQAAVRCAVNKHFSCPQVLPEILDIAKHGQESATAKPTLTGGDKSSPSTSDRGKDPVNEKSLVLWSQSLNCDICKMLLDGATQPRRLKHACRLVLWRNLGHRFANCYVELPLPPAIRDYVGDLKSS